MRQAYLTNEHPDLHMIGGVGEFGAHLPALPVSDSIAHQYDTDEMRAQGWVVRWVEHDHDNAPSLAAPAVLPADAPDFAHGDDVKD